MGQTSTHSWVLPRTINPRVREIRVLVMEFDFNIYVSWTHFWSRVNSQIITIPILKSRDFKHFREKSELRTVLKRVCLSTCQANSGAIWDYNYIYIQRKLKVLLLQIKVVVFLVVLQFMKWRKICIHFTPFIYYNKCTYLRCICKYREWIHYGSKSVKMHFYWIILSHNTIKSQILSIWNTARFLSYSGKWNT